MTAPDQLTLLHRARRKKAHAHWFITRMVPTNGDVCDLCGITREEYEARRPHGFPPAPIGERFWSKVEKGRGCWLWKADVSTSGYGRFWITGPNARQVQAHRFAYEDVVGPIPEGMWVLHTCDNPPCVRPDHLFLGTQQDNTDDMVAKGRQAQGDRHGSRLHPERLARGPRWGGGRLFGERNPSAKLTQAQVDAIRQSNASSRDLAAQYGVGKRAIEKIRSGKRWPHGT